MAEEKDTVLNELKVCTCGNRLHRESAKLNVVYNGISANTWLTPIGISQRRPREGRTHKDTNHEHKDVRLHEDIQKRIYTRAKSASAILGRRFYENYDRTINPEEYVNCVGIVPKISDSTQPPKPAITIQIPPVLNFSQTTLVDSYRQHPRDVDPFRSCKHTDDERPSTTFARYKAKRSLVRPQSTIGNARHVFVLNIEQVFNGGKDDANRNKHTTSPEYNTNNNNVKNTGNDHNDTKHFNTFRSTTSNDENKTEGDTESHTGAPAQTKQASSTNQMDETTPKFKDIKCRLEEELSKIRARKSESIRKAAELLRKPEEQPEKPPLPLYWRTSSTYHRQTRTVEGCMLKPLLYDKELTECRPHDGGCRSYRCRECFQAYLVSADYLDRLEQQRTENQELRRKQSIRHNPTRPHGALVSRALAAQQPIVAKV